MDNKEMTKMMLKYCKKALKIINKMYKWKYMPLKHPVEEKSNLEKSIAFYENKLKNMK